MLCDVCGRDGAKSRRVTRSYGKGKELLVIENIEVTSCPNCGESYLTAETLHEIERIKRLKKTFAHTKPVAVAQFSLAKQS